MDGEELLNLAGEIPIQTEIEAFGLIEADKALIALKKGEIRGAGVLMVG
jgi:D-arabinose 1-dehydrogenase-like Zn-dependent alcohol dehydrogenase